MVIRSKVQIEVDSDFFKNKFEPLRKKLQQDLGLMNLSQVKFTKMISELKIRKFKEPKPIQIKRRRGGRRKIKDEFSMF